MAENLPLFGSWLTQTAELQRSAYGSDPGENYKNSDDSLGRPDKNFPEWIEYVRNQTLAAFVELAEFMQGMKWKPWGKEKRFPTLAERAHLIEEQVDVLHFVANALVALKVTDVELTAAYEKKMEVNRQRMARGGH